SEDPSFQVIQALFEPAYEWDYLSKTPKLTPLTAAGPPEVTKDGKVWTIRFKRGILFTDDPAFKGKPRELTAEDYVYAYKRWLDPNGRRGGAPIITDLIVGARPVIDHAAKSGKFDFDRPIEGLRALDRYTLQIRLNEPNYPNIRDVLGFVGACAREVVEVAVLGGEVATRRLGDNKLRREYVTRGVTREFFPEPFLFSFYFNVADPTIGGLGSERVALRRAVALAIDSDSLVKIVYAGQ